jgi:AcrR family transcriptional regulator
MAEHSDPVARGLRSSRLLASGYACGQETRLRLLAVAIDIFGTHDFDSASTRQIAEAAGVNVASINYHFGGKEGLYAACVEHIGQRAESKLIDPVIATVEARLQVPDLARGELMGLLRAVVDNMTERLVNDTDVEPWARFLQRGRETQSVACTAISEHIDERIVRACAQLLGRILHQAPDEQDTVLRVLLLLGQILPFLSMKRTALRALRWKRYDAEGAASIGRIIWRQLESTLSSADNSVRDRRTSKGRGRRAI